MNSKTYSVVGFSYDCTSNLDDPNKPVRVIVSMEGAKDQQVQAACQDAFNRWFAAKVCRKDHPLWRVAQREGRCSVKFTDYAPHATMDLLAALVAQAGGDADTAVSMFRALVEAQIAAARAQDPAAGVNAA